MKTTLYLTLLSFLTLAFVPNSFAQDDSPEYVVRVIYFIPNDREPQQDIDTKLDTLIKKVQVFYADEMERHKFGRKTFRLETDESDQLIVHRIKGKFTNAHYYRYRGHLRTEEVKRELFEQIDMSKNVIYLFWIDIEEYEKKEKRPGGRGGGGPFSGNVWIEPKNFEWQPGPLYLDVYLTTAHELGHAFGLKHDFRDNRYIMSYGGRYSNQLSRCTAEWLDAHRYFNTTQNSFEQVPTIRMLEPTFVSLPNTISLRFEISHSQRLHQAQLLTNSLTGLTSEHTLLIGCKSLNENNATIEFNTTELALRSEYVDLSVIDVHGNFTTQRFLIDIPSLIPDSDPISITDANLAEAIRKTLGLAPGSTITQLDLLGLRVLGVGERSIMDLTGLEHAIKLQALFIGDNQIVDLTPLEALTNLQTLNIDENKISDVSPLRGLTNLLALNIAENKISDISPLARNTQLQSLYLNKNQISDVKPLAELPNLRRLYLDANQISDVSPLTALKNLSELHLYGNPITDKEPLLNILRQNPNVKIYLKDRRTPLPVTLSHFRAEHTDAGVVLKWTTESEVDNAGFYIYRSENKNGEFKVVNPTMIQGVGTTGERHNYTWTDTTAKPNTVYYYQIEDVSHAGVRKQLATVRIRGLVSARGKLTINWADLKTQE